MFDNPMLPVQTRVLMVLRLLTLQGSYNYETMVGNGIAFAMEPALRLLPGGRGGDAYRAAMARQSRYFNAHPYFASLAVGALARAELSLEAPDRIERFRTAACGPLGSVGDRLVWAAWLPFCSLLALLTVGAGAPPLVVIGVFLVVYNVGHLTIRIWGLNAGWRYGLGIATALGGSVFRNGPAVLTRAASAVAGVAVPVAIAAVAGARPAGVAVIGVLGLVGAVVLDQLHGRVAGWRAALWFLAAATIVAMVVR